MLCGLFKSSMFAKTVFKHNFTREIKWFICSYHHRQLHYSNIFKNLQLNFNIHSFENANFLFEKVTYSFPIYKHQIQKFLLVHTTSTDFKSRNKKEEKKPKNVIQFRPKSKYPVVELWLGITVAELAEKTQRKIGDVFEALSYMDTSPYEKSIKAEIHDKVALFEVARYLGYRAFIIGKPKTKEETENEIQRKGLVRRPPPDLKDLVARPPVVTIMGHVDHGKTTLLDAFRHSSIVEQEFGGITQHIGAFCVKFPSGLITFLDTPGHAAFRAMRARGAHATDIVVLVVAADDGVMEQTIESIKFAKDANVPIIVAINKIDKQPDVEPVKQELLNCGIQLEEFGGDVQAVCISALKKKRLEELTEAILTQAEIIGIKGDPKGKVEGIILESKADKIKGKVSTALIQRGTVKKGLFLVAGTSWAKVRTMFDEYNKTVTEAGPGIPVQVCGWKSLPSAGDEILEADSEKHARQVVELRERIKKEEKMKDDCVVIEKKMEEHFEQYRKERQERLARGRYRKERTGIREKEYVIDTTPNFSFVLKGDVHGSVEAITDIVNTYHSHEACQLDLIHSGVGNVTENDVMLAESFDGTIYCFNVDTPLPVKHYATERNVPIKTFHVIYHLIDDMKNEISKRLPMLEEEDILGEATVLQEFIIKEGKLKVPVAGCKCMKGILKRGNLCKVVRSEEIIYKGSIISLRHEKTDVDTIKKDVECGLRVDNPEISFQNGDIIVCYTTKNVPQVTDWNPGF